MISYVDKHELWFHLKALNILDIPIVRWLGHTYDYMNTELHECTTRNLSHFGNFSMKRDIPRSHLTIYLKNVWPEYLLIKLWFARTASIWHTSSDLDNLSDLTLFYVTYIKIGIYMIEELNFIVTATKVRIDYIMYNSTYSG